MALIIDIETTGQNFSEMDRTTQENLTRWIKRESGGEDGKYNSLLKDMEEGLGFSPLTGEIAAIGVYDSEKDKGVVYYQAPEALLKEEIEENFVFKPMTEAEMLSSFWRGAENYDTFVTFNGRAFDAPFLNIRSAINKIRPSVNLLASRYLTTYSGRITHIDLLDQLTFYGATRRKGSLHLFCRAFGIKSPKASGISGDDVTRLFKEKKYKEIAEYNSWDLIATLELYKIWKDYLKF